MTTTCLIGDAPADLDERRAVPDAGSLNDAGGTVARLTQNIRRSGRYRDARDIKIVKDRDHIVDAGRGYPLATAEHLRPPAPQSGA